MCSRADLARRYADVLRECEAAGLTIRDGRDVAVFDDVMRLRRDGLKMEYCATYASERYRIHPSRVWRILRHFRAEGAANVEK